MADRMNFHLKFFQIIFGFYKQIGILYGFFPFILDPVSRRAIFGPTSMIIRANLTLVFQIFLLTINLCTDDVFKRDINSLNDPNILVQYLSDIIFYVLMISIFFSGYMERKNILQCLNQYIQLTFDEKSLSSNFCSFSIGRYGLQLKFVLDQILPLLMTGLLALTSTDKNCSKLFRVIFFYLSILNHGFVSMSFFASLTCVANFIQIIKRHLNNVLLTHSSSDEIDFLSKMYEEAMNFSRRISQIFRSVLFFCYAALLLGLTWTVRNYFMSKFSHKFLDT